MPDEKTRKWMLLEYASRITRGDIEAVTAMFSDDIRFEDPAGSPPIVGLPAVRRHLAWAIGLHVHETPGTPVASMDGRHAAIPLEVTLYQPTRVVFHLIALVEVGDDALIHRVQAFWGVTDTSVYGADGSCTAPTAVAEALAQLQAARAEALESPGSSSDYDPRIA